MRIWFHLIAGLVAIVFTAGFTVSMANRGVNGEPDWWAVFGFCSALFGVFWNSAFMGIAISREVNKRMATGEK